MYYFDERKTLTSVRYGGAKILSRGEKSSSLLTLQEEEEAEAEQDQQQQQSISPVVSVPPELGPPRVGSGERGGLHPYLSQLHSESVEVSPMNYVYELSGIVIHSGQAHAGHYYSFIRDRGRMES